jgi:hypothetical protein
VRQLLLLLEHVLLKDAAVPADDRDRADVVEAPHPPRVRELDHVVGALDVGGEHRLAGGLDVVDGGEVEEVVDRLVELLDAEPRLRQVAGHRRDVALGRPEAPGQVLDLPAGALADEHVDGPFALQELPDQGACPRSRWLP